MQYKILVGVVICCLVIPLRPRGVIAPIKKIKLPIGKINTMYQRPKVAEAVKKPVSRGGHIKYGEKVVEVVATAYCSCKKCCGKTDGITASGKKAAWGTIAAPKDIPFGTIIILNNLGTFTVMDRGGSINRLGNNIIKIDVWFPSHQEALNFGVKKYITKLIYPKEVK